VRVATRNNNARYRGDGKEIADYHAREWPAVDLREELWRTDLS